MPGPGVRRSALLGQLFLSEIGGSSDGANVFNKLDEALSPASWSARMAPKNESENPPF